MTFKALIQAIRLYIRVEGAEVDERIKTFINDAVLQFARKDEWTHLLRSVTLLTDGSEQYDVEDLIPEPYAAIRDIGIDGQDPLDKVSYPEYISSEGTENWTIHNGELYLAGTGTTYRILYVSCGDPYPLTSNDEESVAIKYYPDIIQQMVIVRYMNFLGDDESARVELARLNQLLTELKRSEARAVKLGRSVRLSAHNR